MALVEIRQLALTKRVAIALPRWSSDGDAGITWRQMKLAKPVCWAHASALNWRNGVGCAVLMNVCDGQNVWIAAIDYEAKAHGVPFCAII